MADEEKRSAVVDGKLLAVSPTLISKFDATSPYDCERRGYFVYALGRKEPSNEKMTRGVHLAKMTEVYLKENKLLLGTEDQTRWFDKLRPHLDTIKPRLVGSELEMPEGFTVAGVPVNANSKADIVLDGPPEIQDLKTTGSIEKNGKSENKLKKDTQLALYHAAFYPDAPEVKRTLLYLQVEGALLFKPVSVTVSQTELDSHLRTTIVPLVERIKSIVSEKDIKKVTADRRKCFRCPHRSYCPPDKENPLMSIFDKFKTPAAAAAPVTPPDQPKSDPAQAAKPVENFSPIPPPKTEAEKKERKMKITDTDAPAAAPAEDDEEALLLKQLAAAKAKKEAAAKAAAEAAAKAEAEKKAAEAAAAAQSAPEAEETGEEKKNKGGRPPGSKNKPKLDGEETTEVAYGVTMNLGIDVGAVRIDVRRSKRHGLGEAGEVYEQLLGECKAAVEEEMKKVTASPAGKK